jgi:hypothetical protein
VPPPPPPHSPPAAPSLAAPDNTPSRLCAAIVRRAG